MEAAIMEAEATGEVIAITNVIARAEAGEIATAIGIIVEEAKSADGGIKPPTKFLPGSAMKMQNADAAWIKCIAAKGRRIIGGPTTGSRTISMIA